MILIALGELTLILILAWGVDRLAGSRLRPRIRAAIWSIVLFRMVLPPGLLRWPGASLVVDASRVAPEMAVTALTSIQPAAGWMVSIWVGGAWVLIATWLIRSRRLRRRLETLDANDICPGVVALAHRLGLKRPPAVAVDPVTSSPYVTGLLAPTLVLPRDWHTWPAEARDHAIAHELTHLVRRDLWMEAFWRLVVAAYWFHPLAHVARRRAHEAREMCCDAETASLVGPAYRVTLLHLVAAMAGERSTVSAAPAGHGWHPAIARLRALERWPTPPSWRQRLAGGGLLAAVIVVAVPTHTDVRVPTKLSIEAIADPVTRQEMGLGSLHLRYALIGEQK